MWFSATQVPLKQRGAALLVSMIILVTLTAIGFAVFFASRSGLKHAGLDAKTKELRATAQAELNRVADHINNFFRNEESSHKQPLVFVKDPTSTPPVYYSATDNEQFHHISLDPAQGNAEAMITDLLGKFTTLFNNSGNYYAAWTNPNTGSALGVFSKGQADNIDYMVWAEGVNADASGQCLPGSGTAAVVCIDNIKYGGNASTPALRMILHASVSARSGSTANQAYHQHISRPFWLVAAPNANVNYGRLEAKTTECAQCHAFTWGSVGMAGSLNLVPRSRHPTYTSVTGMGRFAAMELLDQWPMSSSIIRRVNCAHPDNPCSTHPVHGQFLEKRFNDTANDSGESYFLYNSGGSTADGYNGTNFFSQGIEQNVSDPSLLSIPQPIVDRSSGTAPVNNFCNPYDGNCKSNPATQADKYVNNNYFDLRADLARSTQTAGSYSYLRSDASQTLEVHFSSGKRRGGDPNNTGDSAYADPWAEDGSFGPNIAPSVLTTNRGTSAWVIPGTSKTIDKTFTHIKKIDVSAGGLGGGSGGGSGHVGGGSLTGVIQKKTGVDSSHGLYIPGNVTISGNVEVCGQIVAHDVVFGKVNYTVPADCETGSATILALGNVYFTHDFKAAGNPDPTNGGANLPGNGVEYTTSEVQPGVAVIAAGNVVIGNPNSYTNWQLLPNINDKSAGTKANAAHSDPSEALLYDNYYDNTDYIDSNGVGYSSGFVRFDNDRRDHVQDEMIPLALWKLNSSGTATVSSQTPHINYVGAGFLPLGGVFDTTQSQWNSRGSFFDGPESSPWFTGTQIRTKMAEWDPSWLPAGDPGFQFGSSGESSAYISSVHQIHAVIMGENIYGHGRSIAGVGAVDSTGPIRPESLPNFDQDKDGLTIIGTVIARKNSYLFFPGGTYVFFNPHVIDKFPVLEQVVRVVVSSSLKVHNG